MAHDIRELRSFQKVYMRLPADAARAGVGNAPILAAPDATVLGIHSSVAGDSHEFGAGHAWLTITAEGRTCSYGLWPDGYEQAADNGDASDIRLGLESAQDAVASRYYGLSPVQVVHFWSLTRLNVTWRCTNNCASWATEVVASVVGEDVDADDYLGLETPRELGRSILKLESREPTHLASPKVMHSRPASSSWYGWLRLTLVARDPSGT